MSTRKPPKGKRNIILCIKEETLEILGKLAKHRDESRNKVIVTIIEEYLEEAMKDVRK